MLRLLHLPVVPSDKCTKLPVGEGITKKSSNMVGLLQLKEDRPTPAAVYNWRVYTCAAIASFASCTIGYDSGSSLTSHLHLLPCAHLQ